MGRYNSDRFYRRARWPYTVLPDDQIIDALTAASTLGVPVALVRRRAIYYGGIKTQGRWQFSERTIELHRDGVPSNPERSVGWVLFMVFIAFAGWGLLGKLVHPPLWFVISTIVLWVAVTGYGDVLVRAIPSQRQKQDKLRAAQKVRSDRLWETFNLLEKAKRGGWRPPIGGDSYGWWSAELYKADHTCTYCNRQFHRSELVKEHDIPYSKGGAHHVSNIVVACRHCNQLKGVKTGAEFRAWLAVHPSALTYTLRNRSAREYVQPPPSATDARQERSLARDEVIKALEELSAMTNEPIPAKSIVELASSKSTRYSEATLQVTLSQAANKGFVERVGRGMFRPVS